MPGKPNWDALRQPLTDHTLFLAIEAWLEFGEDTLNQCHKGMFSQGGAHYETLKRHLEQMRKDRRVQQHSNLTRRIR